MNPKHSMSKNGFTLIELAIVLFIMGLLIAGLVGPIETQLEARDRNATMKSMDKIIEALNGFAITNGRLPCPNIDGNGLEQLDFNGSGIDDIAEFDDTTTPTFSEVVERGGQCLGVTGFIPWATLGVEQGDAWGNRYLYRVSMPDFTTKDTDNFCDGNDAPTEFDLCATGDLTVESRGDNPATAATVEGKAILTLGMQLPAVLVSHGKNALGAISVSGIVRPVPSAGTDELKNADGDTDFISRIYTAGSTGCADNEVEASALCEYDDIVKWISPALLNNRMVAAGQLP
jgi:prepilin-type N-terminal cleavage/methylation domain-containing protein